MNNQELSILSVPDFSISEFEQGDSSTKNLMKKALRECCKEHGFFTVSDHGISKSLIQNTLQVTRKFFSLPIEIKRLCVSDNILESQMKERGYVEKEFNYNNPISKDAPLDLNEGFLVGRNLTQEQIDNLSNIIKKECYSNNIWPEGFPEMKSIMDAYYEEMFLLSIKVRDLLQYALDFEVPHCEYATSLIRMNYYPRIIKKASPGQMRISEHADFCMFTILLTEDINSKQEKIEKVTAGGLEVFAKEKGWCGLSYDRLSFVVNCGDTLDSLSNKKCKSSLHRVRVPKPDPERDNSRVSLAYFCSADYAFDKNSIESYQKIVNDGNKR